MSNSPRQPTIPEDIDALRKRVTQLENEVRRYEENEARIASQIDADEEREDAAKKKQERREQRARAELDAARAAAIRAIAKLVPQASKQARLGKPALLRMILRATR